MNPQIPDHPEDADDFPAPNISRLSPWTRWPIFMYLTIVTVFAILAIFVVRYVLIHAPGGS